MSNNKQSSVEWVVQEINKLTGLSIAPDEPIIEQAKKIEREYLIDFYIKGCEDTYGMDEGHNDSKDAEEGYPAEERCS